MGKWEYKIVDLDDVSELNNLRKNGWEMTTTVGAKAYFKRFKESSEKNNDSDTANGMLQIDLEQTVEDLIEHLEKTVFQHEEKKLATKGRKFYRNEWAYHNLEDSFVQSWLLEQHPGLLKIMNSHPDQFDKLVVMIRDETEYQISMKPWKSNMNKKKDNKS